MQGCWGQGMSRDWCRPEKHLLSGGRYTPEPGARGGWVWKLGSSYLLGSKLWGQHWISSGDPFQGEESLGYCGRNVDHEETKRTLNWLSLSISFFCQSENFFFFLSFLRGCVSWGNYYFLFAFDKNSANHFWVFSRNLWQGGWKAWGTR